MSTERLADSWADRIAVRCGMSDAHSWTAGFGDRLVEVLSHLLVSDSLSNGLPEVLRICIRRTWSESHAGTTVPSSLPPSAVVIVGLPRSGTTFLHNVLAYSCEVTTPRAMDMLYWHTEPSRRRRDTAERASVALNRCPDLADCHRVPIGGPDECSTGMLNHLSGMLPSVMWSSRFIPMIEGHIADDGLHRHLADLSAIRGPDFSRERVLLKSPDHALRLDTLRRVLPGARFVALDRSADDMNDSWSRLLAAVRKSTAAGLAPGEDRMFAQLWKRARERLNDDDGCDVLRLSFESLVEEPEMACHRIADFTGLVADARKIERATALLGARRSTASPRHDRWS